MRFNRRFSGVGYVLVFFFALRPPTALAVPPGAPATLPAQPSTTEVTPPATQGEDEGDDDDDDDAGQSAYAATVRDRVAHVLELARGLHGFCSADGAWPQITAAEVRASESLAKALDVHAHVELHANATTAQKAAANAAISEAVARWNAIGASAARAAFFAEVCTPFCTTHGIAPTQANVVDVCTLRTSIPASAAVLGDWDTVERLATYLEARVTAFDDAVEMNLADAARERPPGRFWDLIDGIHALVDQDESGTGALAGFATQFVEMGASALARLIEDRARREGIGWFLDRLGDDVCSGPELKTHWLPSLCALAEGDRLVGYGAGARMLASLREAIEDDLRRWPGAATGYAVSAVVYGDAGLPARCSDDGRGANCTKLATLRAQTAHLMGELVDGGNATQLLRELGIAMHAAAPEAPSGAPPDAALMARERALAWLGCGMAMPNQFMLHYEALDPLRDPRARAASVLLATFVSEDTCASFVVGDSAVAPNVPGLDVKRLKAIVSLSGEVSDAAMDLAIRWTNVRNSARELARAYEALATQPQISGDLPAMPEGEDADLAAWSRAVEDAQRTRFALARGPAYLSFVGALTAFTNATVALADGSLAAFSRLAHANLLVGACSGTCTPTQITALRTSLADATRWLDVIARGLDAATAVARGAWTELGGDVLAIFGEIRRLPPANTTFTFIDALVERLAILTAIVDTGDPEVLAELLDEAATPVGGWRRKTRTDAFVLSLTAHPGIFFGAESRWGQYGTVLERGGDIYAVAPTVAFPLGIDLAWGTGKRGISTVGVFVSLLDPLAFLGYDVDRDGELPGPQILTVVAPGLGLRLGVGESPFSIIPTAVFRPAYRTPDAQVSGPGASVLQVGVMLSVDVTLYELVVRDGAN